MAPLWQGPDSHSLISFSQLTPGGGRERYDATVESTGREIWNSSDDHDDDSEVEVAQTCPDVYISVSILVVIKPFFPFSKQTE